MIACRGNLAKAETLLRQADGDIRQALSLIEQARGLDYHKNFRIAKPCGGGITSRRLCRLP